MADKTPKEEKDVHQFQWGGADAMTLSGLETQHSPQALVSSSQDRREVTATRASNDATDRSKERSAESRGPSPIQDQVTLSKEAQTLSVANSQTSKNSTFQQSPSPFDR